MTQAAQYIDDAGEFWIWLVRVMSSVPNPKNRDPEFLFDIGEDTWTKYKSLADSAKGLHPVRATMVLPDGKHLKKIVMSRAFDLMQETDRRILIRIWAHIAITSAGKGNPPSEEFIEFIAFILRKCPENLLEKGIRTVRGLKQ